MFKPAKMKKIRIFALKSTLPTVIKSLHELGMVEIRKFTVEGLERGRPLSFFDEVSEQLVKLRSMASLMDQDIVKSVKLRDRWRASVEKRQWRVQGKLMRKPE